MVIVHPLRKKKTKKGAMAPLQNPLQGASRTGIKGTSPLDPIILQSIIMPEKICVTSVYLNYYN
ncbi:hypothetical protein MBAV_004917 [Candidatus Magnetobacterium bavaricum]|uniref:Uncharacterized protein n=1 Tax=Candidatus Magnetobacterium bavaricum TaxID=29290 RepID=A0A0F3GM43_9BACT|nr:hypothetical protein MBAV_004917 [Candidatus Magnetobacterium bavaricum]